MYPTDGLIPSVVSGDVLMFFSSKCAERLWLQVFRHSRDNISNYGIFRKSLSLFPNVPIGRECFRYGKQLTDARKDTTWSAVFKSDTVNKM